MEQRVFCGVAAVPRQENCQQCGKPEIGQYGILEGQQHGNLAILHGAAHLATSVAGNLAMQNAKRW